MASLINFIRRKMASDFCLIFIDSYKRAGSLESQSHQVNVIIEDWSMMIKYNLGPSF